MKKLIVIFVLFVVSTAARSAHPEALATLRAVHDLSNADAHQALPVAFEATVLYRRLQVGWLFVQDDGVAIFVRPPAGFNQILTPGDRILVQGVTHDSFRTFIVGSQLTLLYHGELPKPAPATFDEMVRGDHDAQLVSVRAVLRSVNPGLTLEGAVISTTLQLSIDGGIIDATVDGDHQVELSNLLDDEVEVTGVESGEWDGKMQLIGIVLRLTSPDEIKVVKRGYRDQWSIPMTPMDAIFTNYHVQNLSRRVRVHGTITYYQPGAALILQSGDKSLWINTLTTGSLRIGDEADAAGFPDVHEGALVLNDADVLDSQFHAPIAPTPVTWKQLANRGSDVRNRIFDLVSIEGQVVTEVREAAQDEYVVLSDGQLFTAIYSHTDLALNSKLPPMLAVAPGSRIRLTGICIPQKTNPLGVQAFHSEEPFSILLRTPEDIAVIAGPPFLSIRNLLIIAGLLLSLVLAAVARGWMLDRKLRRQTAALAARIEAEAALERRRSRILEDINGSRPLAEILEEITGLVSMQLNHAPCWCEVVGGARLGDSPERSMGLRIVRENIASRSGPSLGRITAAFEALSQACDEESEALAVGARLATLAIETRRLYSDLRHRSEFDQLTDIHNRFSLDKCLDAMIVTARQNAEIFGLIYIDLDRFKLVNDQYGHHIGDLFLQEVALRMKRQLRPHDTLARLGGDEFAALVPVVRSRAEVEEIAQRLERCFDEPFAIEDLSLQGAASIGLALYPEDGASRDSLLNAADVAMYTIKKARKQQLEMPVSERER